MSTYEQLTEAETLDVLASPWKNGEDKTSEITPLKQAELDSLHVTWLTYERDQARVVAAQQQYNLAMQAFRDSETDWNKKLAAEQFRCHAKDQGVSFETGAWLPKES